MAVAFVSAAPPGPVAITAVTGVPLSLTEFPFASWSWTAGCWTNATPLCALLDGAVVSASFVATPAVPVAVNVTGLPDNVPEEAVRVFDPAVGLSVHEVRAAIPSAPVLTGVVGVTVPLPSAGVNVTATPVTGFPFASLTITDGGGLTAVPAGAVGLVGLFGAMVAAAPAVAVAVKITGLPASPLAVARAVSVRTVVPRVQEVAVATPLPSVVTGVGGFTVPLAPVALNVTATPETGFPFASFTSTEGGELTAAPAVPGWLVGLFAAIVAAVPAVAVAVKITGLPASPLAVARAVSVRTVVPRVQEVAVATPLPSVVTGVAGFTVPLAPVALNVTATPETGFPFASFTITEGGELTAAPAVPGWLVGLFEAIVAAAPAVAVAVKITGLPASPLAVARAVSVRTVVPRVQEVAVATPLPSVVTGVAGFTVPFAPVALNVTATPETGFPFASFTITEGGELTAAPAVPSWLVGLFAAIVAAVPAVSVIVPDVGAVSVPL